MGETLPLPGAFPLPFVAKTLPLRCVLPRGPQAEAFVKKQPNYDPREGRIRGYDAPEELRRARGAIAPLDNPNQHASLGALYEPLCRL